MHAIVTTPAEHLGASIARFPRQSSLPRNSDGSASALSFSRPARRSLPYGLHIRQATKVALYTGGFSRLSMYDCSDCYRLERQLPGGLRTHWKTVPLHGALNSP